MSSKAGRVWLVLLALAGWLALAPAGAQVQPAAEGPKPAETAGPAARIKVVKIEEPGLKALGQVEFDPESDKAGRVSLSLASGRPDRVLKFLSRYVKLPPELAARLKAKNLSLVEADFSFGRPEIDLRIKTLTLDHQRLEAVVLKAAGPAKWSLRAGSGGLELAETWSLMQRWPVLRQALGRALAGAGLKTLRAKGRLELADLELSVDLSAEGAGPSLIGIASLRLPQADLSAVLARGGSASAGLTSAEGRIKLSLDRTEIEVQAKVARLGGLSLNQVRASLVYQGLDGTGEWRLTSEHGAVNLGQAWGLTQRLPWLADRLNRLLAGPGLKGLGMKGSAELTRIDLSKSLGQPTGAGLSGAVGLRLHQVALTLPARDKSGPPLAVNLPQAALDLSLTPQGGVKVDNFSLILARGQDKLLEIESAGLKAAGPDWTASAGRLAADLTRLQALLERSAAVQKVIQGFQGPLGLNKARVTGRLRIENLQAGRESGQWRVKGSLDLDQAGLDWIAAASDGERKYRILFPKVSGRLDHGPQKSLFDALTIQVADGSGGRLNLTGRAVWPLDPDQSRLTLEAEKFNWQGWRLDGRLAWDRDSAEPMAMSLERQNSWRLEMTGRLQPWRPAAGLGLDLICTAAKLAWLPGRPEPEKAPEILDLNRLLLPGGPPEVPFPVRLQVDHLDLPESPSLERLRAQILPAGQAGEPRVLQTAFGWCQMGVVMDLSADKNGRLSLNALGRIRDVSLPNLIGCGLRAIGRGGLPIYIDGRAYGYFKIGLAGKTLRDFQDSFKADLTLNVREGLILKLSNLHWSLSWITQVLRYARVNPTLYKDALPFDTLTLKADFTSQGALAEPVTISSSVFTLSGGMQVDLVARPPVMRLDFLVNTQGTVKHWRERVVIKEDEAAPPGDGRSGQPSLPEGGRPEKER